MLLQGLKNVPLILKGCFFLLALIILAILLIKIWPESGKPEIDLSFGRDVRIWRTEKQTVETMPLEEAVLGVLAGEMSASQPEEALKAQAVAARTYILKQAASGVHAKQGADICDDYHHCQAYLDAEARALKWGEDTDKWEAKLRQAVKDTAGEVLIADGEYLNAYFCAVCGGHTELPQDYWQSEEPGLGSVPCYWDYGHAKYKSVEIFTASELAEKLDVAQSSLARLHVSAISPTGRVQEVSSIDHVWKGIEWRTLLGLNSTNFNWLQTQEGYIFFVHGYGHGVGMCQAGACGMAKAGYDYRKILLYYYPGAEFKRIN